jgi:hypothetical protein
MLGGWALCTTGMGAAGPVHMLPSCHHAPHHWTTPSRRITAHARRARYLLDGAKHVVDKLGGLFPETAKELLAIPGGWLLPY